MRWAPGETAVLSFVRSDASVSQRHPLRVLADDGTELLGWLPAGTEIVGTRLADGRQIREAPLGQRFVLPRMRVRDRWRDCSTLRLIREDEWSSVWWFFDGGGSFLAWYVNLEIPLGRGRYGPERIDGALDVVVEPGGRWSWKDEDEAAEAVRAGRLSRQQLARLRAEGERLIERAESGAFPFDGTWTEFRPDPRWPMPRLPVELWAQDIA
ncbi:hypothetical protein FHU38_003842 [Saccharomonospora amisosensis]|uniref:DUF402 domain-containing protein n=1 Tax=Saccharomonospora amisosensis TaxID=1128677 RepID=A0A7X5UTP1_9PSEU|nr:DUF402 domain-containing protein [Saccharomonospora amisosensis]NIJ13498.1 hypothetical protein [Saccharomonospora amisosensis]